MKKRICLSSYLLFLLLITPAAAGIKPGDIITQETISHAKGLLTPSPRWMVERGMRMTALDTKRVEWPKAYKKATDKYASQVVLLDTGTELHHYIAGTPFPTIDPNDQQAGFKIVWNYEQNPYIIDNVGTDFDIDSYWDFNTKISYWTFRLLAQKEILAVVHSGKYGDASAWCAPRDGTHGIVAALPCVLWEKRKVWVVEGTPTGYTSPYAYSKRIFYIDQDFYGQLLQEMYNRKGELWKSYFMCYYVTNKPYWGYPIWAGEKPSYEDEDEWPFIPNGMMLDLLTERATTFDAPPSGKAPPEWRREWQFNLAGKANSPDVYSVPYLIRTGK